jgi:NADPH:quinone reductase-like Zn-dependent oxidoreductase
MRAVSFAQYGPPDVLRLSDRPAPEPGPGQVLIRVAAAGVNPADANLRSGSLRWVARTRLPFVPGSDVAGTVAALGPGVSGRTVGERVFAMTPVDAGGGYAELVAVRAADVAPAPATLTSEQAASVPLAALTALTALRDRGRLEKGRSVLVVGAAGGVGSFAVQIGQILGAHVVAAAGAGSAGLLHDLGADEVLDRSVDDGLDARGRYDVVFDAVGVHPFGRMRPALRRTGVAVTVSPRRGNPLAAGLSRMRPGPALTGFLVRPSGPDLAVLAGWADAGLLRPVIERCYALHEAADAHRRIETRRTRGKLVLRVSAD